MSESTETKTTPVLIAGGGPVGMTLALELARHEIRSILVERNDTTTQHPKMGPDERAQHGTLSAHGDR